MLEMGKLIIIQRGQLNLSSYTYQHSTQNPAGVIIYILCDHDLCIYIYIMYRCLTSSIDFFKNYNLFQAVNLSDMTVNINCWAGLWRLYVYLLAKKELKQRNWQIHSNKHKKYSTSQEVVDTVQHWDNDTFEQLHILCWGAEMKYAI